MFLLGSSSEKEDEERASNNKTKNNIDKAWKKQQSIMKFRKLRSTHIDQYDPGRNIATLKTTYSEIKNKLPDIIKEIKEKQNNESIIPR